MRTPWLLLAALPLALGCSSSGDDLSVSAVTSIPDGTGTGTAASGIYTMQLDVTGCSGSCTTTVDGFAFALCTVGPAGSASMTVTQTAGHLTVQSDSGNLVVQDFSGGIDANGDFDVGGTATAVDGQNLTVASRAQGSLTGDAATATAASEGTGTVNGSVIDCLQTLQMSGSR
jgi:hypothetical protein